MSGLLYPSPRQSLELKTGVSNHSLGLLITARLRTRSPAADSALPRPLLHNQVTTNPVAINEIFKGFYTNLYKAETDFDEPICKQYLDKLELPRISQMDKKSLEAPLSLEELHVALKSLQKGKSPGLDGPRWSPP